MYSQTQLVHSLNVLRALFRSSNLGDAVQPYVGDGLKSAVKGYQSQVRCQKSQTRGHAATCLNKAYGDVMNLKEVAYP